ncbi:cytochrome c oxidase subunit II [Sphingomonas sp. MAH-20]|uniref:Cytochrome aa3 subunit 2 n=1 Tax=Sphingomonas horti TaxID=2682842 RepID=A0A6I4J1P2_9SPHN|nr:MULTISPECIES: cytochrome c oxidase subunit II [Sphingomonas]MBA2919455.1 cytochrome c oxidase subunit II [Sphingomonas sp. CGMCC 1.13658]MVO78335.1 cytochrome c oxidase subunit II [Sphingomonas horti]
MRGFPVWPVEAGHYAGEMDALFIGLVIVTVLTAGFVCFLLIFFAARYRAGHDADRSHTIEKTWRWEVGWTTASLLIFVGLAVWGADLYLRLYRPPKNAVQIFVVGKQWMWKAQHPGGQREINELHVPAGRAIRLVMASQDTIHSFYVPALRVKQDVVPGRYESMWFQADRPGRYHLFCAEYCGTDHARMGGWLTVMAPRAFAGWLRDRGGQQSLAAQGEQLFHAFGCSGCHGPGGTVRAPDLNGVYGGPVALQDGRVVSADERYVRDSILMPKSEVAAGYDPVMPSFAGQVGEDDLAKLVAYVQSLGRKGAG